MFDLPVSTGRIAQAIVIASMGCAIAVLMTAPLIGGLFVLLRDVFGALTLPFSLLFGMAGRDDHTAALGHVVGAMGSDLLRHPVRALCAAALCGASAVLFILARGRGARAMLVGAATASVGAAWLGGYPVALVLAPGFVTECLCAVRPAAR
ncbi:hypothetical protein [Gluconacetobacter azotocaptans]|uniref:hypothetical protein n=1 Tax=Gluconacetobacter azotocaptans TaxID=142834 RepID=UPI001F0379C5|nr:hypothetical protein [Gluconacetobacter azotocaptans]